MPFLEELEPEPQGDGTHHTDDHASANASASAKASAKHARAERLADQANKLIQNAHWEEAADALATALQLQAQPPAA
eukprot:COSAG02_NODE_36538_length_453_cov_1.008475_1_plen_76_part_01